MKSFVKSDCLDTKINIPDNVEFIELINCPRIKFLSFPESTKIIKCINCKRLDNVVLPKNTESINFKDCFNLKNIILNSGLLRIEHDGFKGCLNLKSIEIPDSVIEFGKFDKLYDYKKEHGCFENFTIVKFIDKPSKDINLLIENEKLKRQIKKYKSMLNIINKDKQNDEQDIIDKQINLSWYDDQCYETYKYSPYIVDFLKSNYKNDKQQNDPKLIPKIKSNFEKLEDKDDSEEPYNW